MVGMSFGAIISLLAISTDVNKLILLSPVLLFNQKEISKVINFDFKSQMLRLVSLLKNAFPYSYRIRDLKKLRQFLLGNDKQLDRESIEKRLGDLKIKTLIVHGKLDTSVPWQVSESLRESVKESGNIVWSFPPDVAHSSKSYSERVLDEVSAFIKS